MTAYGITLGEAALSAARLAEAYDAPATIYRGGDGKGYATTAPGDKHAHRDLVAWGYQPWVQVTSHPEACR